MVWIQRVLRIQDVTRRHRHELPLNRTLKGLPQADRSLIQRFRVDSQRTNRTRYEHEQLKTSAGSAEECCHAPRIVKAVVRRMSKMPKIERDKKIPTHVQQIFSLERFLSKWPTVYCAIDPVINSGIDIKCNYTYIASHEIHFVGI
jgi:hypothetical protein